jgi:hypothetical protein
LKQAPQGVCFFFSPHVAIWNYLAPPKENFFMQYSKLVAVTRLPGLFELLSSRADGAVVRSLDDNKTQFVASRIHNFSHLESIEIFTQRDNVNLVDIFAVMEKAGNPLPDVKDAEAVKKYFQKVYPEMDFERVYASDMKKMIKWFDSLKKHNIEIKLTEEPEQAEEPAPEVKEEPVKGEKPAKKETAKEAQQKEEKIKDKKPKEEPKKKSEGKKKQ